MSRNYGGLQWNPRHAFLPTLNLLAGCTYIPELIFTPGLETNTVRLKSHRFQNGMKRATCIPHLTTIIYDYITCDLRQYQDIPHRMNICQ